MKMAAACKRAASRYLPGSTLTLLALPAGAEVRLPAIVSDHMVLQRAARVPVWGWASFDEAVSLPLGSQVRSTRGEANEIVVRDVLVKTAALSAAQLKRPAAPPAL